MIKKYIKNQFVADSFAQSVCFFIHQIIYVCIHLGPAQENGQQIKLFLWTPQN